MTAARDTAMPAKAAPNVVGDDETPPSGPGRKDDAAKKADPPATPSPAQRAPAHREPPTTSKQAPAPGSRDAVQRLRRERVRRLATRMGLFVALPTVLAAFYYALIASDQYESYAQFTVHSVESRASGIDSLFGSFVGAHSRDTLVARDYILSRDMLSQLDQDHAYVEHWKSPEVDFIARLAADASFEDVFEHYLDQVEVTFDSNSGVLTLRVRAMAPDQAQQLAQSVIDRSEAMVNSLSERERADQTRDAEEHVKTSEARLTKARQALLAQQQQHAELNPQQTAGAAMAVRTSLEGELARARAELMELRSFMTANAPKVKAAQQRVKALSAQVGAERARLVNPSGDGGIAGSMAEFEAAMVEKEFAEAAYRSALATLELARAEAARQHRYLAVVSAPSLPDESTHPRRFIGVLTVFLLSFLIMGIGSLLIASVREHARV